jgi:hypothetical protein
MGKVKRKNRNGTEYSLRHRLGRYPKGVSITKSQLEKLSLGYDSFHPDWNYSLCP